jgi:3-methyladenine DNA glycosylase AlkC
MPRSRKLSVALEVAPKDKPARTMATIPAETLRALHEGTLETRTLVEILAIDLRVLMAHALPSVPKAAWRAIDPDEGITRRMALAASAAHGAVGPRALAALIGHQSDVVRGVAAYIVGQTTPRLGDALELVRPLADDANPGTREWAWLALRPLVAADVSGAIARLKRWTTDDSPNIRRIASEITRPRGVWCTHLGELKADPRPGLALLEPLRADPSGYVQDSVANWLNDAGKSDARFVRELCARWGKAPVNAATARILKRATRNL